MAAPKKATPRGRPPSITRERIADAGIEMTLPSVSIVGVAALLGVSHIGLYKHVANLAALRELVAEVIFERWQAPPLATGRKAGLEADLLAFQRSLRDLVDRNPGLAPFLAVHGAKTPQMVERIEAHQRAFAEAHGLNPAQAAWLLSTVAYHCVALADTVYARQRVVEDGRRAHDPVAAQAEFELGMLALIRGAVAMLPSLPAGKR
jgi:hypothetical protein